MKTIVVMLAMLLGTVAFANDQYAPKQNERINLYKVVSENCLMDQVTHHKLRIEHNHCLD